MLTRVLDRFRRPTPFPALAPDQAFVALGDVHGRADLLNRALNRVGSAQVVCVGDYVDRGEQSAEVLRTLSARGDIICLSGNHESMMLRFIDDPAQAGPRWLRYGGLQTLASFGVRGTTPLSDGAALRRARDTLVEAMGGPLVAWLRDLPTRWQSGNVAVVHAAADPHTPIADQSSAHLRWGHAAFHQTRRKDGVWVVHGHTIVDAPRADEGRISIDTGAFATGRLTLAHIDRDGVRFDTIR
ncbi:metallophosphoesterase [Tateyamaria sp. SN6-1]|uniref:metallophosphoesterase n=1 Tax=Tateyamaria sp. SN6-1 TaxID=3092148 RepID=UPI0039F51F0C